ncbi:Hypothetical predicted protein, partial [Pelobates cultripes]
IWITEDQEGQGSEDIENSLIALFMEILGDEAPTKFDFDRAHRAIRPRVTE